MTRPHCGAPLPAGALFLLSGWLARALPEKQ